MKNLSAINENKDLVNKEYVDNGLALKQPTLISGTNIKTINNESILGSGNINIGGGGGGNSIDVQINGNSIVDNDVANIVTKTPYDSSTNPLVTENDFNEKQNKLYKLSWEHLISSVMATQVDGYVKNALVDLSVGSLDSADIQAIINLATSQKNVFLNSREYMMEKMAIEEEDGNLYALTYNIEMIEDEQEAEQYELGIERIDSSKPCFFLILTPNKEMPNGYLLIIGSSQTIVNTTWNFAIEEDIHYLSNVAITGNYNDLKNIPTDIEHKIPYIFNNQTYYYQFYGARSIAGIIVNVGVEVDVVYATLLLIIKSIEEMKQSYSNTLAAIQGIHIPDDVYEQPVLIINVHNLGCMTCYIDESTKYVTQAIFTNFANGYSVNFGENPNELTVYYSALNSDDYLSKTNTNTYTPASDYNPATKKYVDDSITNVAFTNQANSFSNNQTFNGNITVNGNITQNGSAYETHAEKVFSKNDYITLRDGATGGLVSGTYSGFQAKKYDGTNDGRLVFDSNGVARVGDIGDEQALATRAENPIDGATMVWDANSLKMVSGFKIISCTTTQYNSFSKDSNTIYLITD